MQGGQDDETEKTLEPTPRKLEEARRKGDVAKSQDLNATAAYAGLVLALLMAGSGAFNGLATGMMVLLDQPAQLGKLFFEGSSAPSTGEIMRQMVPFLALIFSVPALAVILSAIAQQSVTFAGSKLSPKLSRINPISNAKQKFGISGLFEFFKSFLKLLIYSIILTIFIYGELEDIIASSSLAPVISISYLSELALRFLMIVVVVSAIIGAIDFVFQYNDHRRKLRMSFKELKDETKETEGDPYLKQERRQRAQERAMNQTLKDVETADVVITNPTHYAIALHWSRMPGSAPTCVAKGVDEVALAIRERAIEHGVPIHEDPPTARALHATTEIGQEIPPDLYQAVATAIRFAEAIRQKMRTRGF